MVATPQGPPPVCVMESASKNDAGFFSLAARALPGKGFRDQGAQERGGEVTANYYQ